MPRRVSCARRRLRQCSLSRCSCPRPRSVVERLESKIPVLDRMHELVREQRLRNEVLVRAIDHRDRSVGGQVVGAHPGDEIVDLGVDHACRRLRDQPHQLKAHGQRLGILEVAWVEAIAQLGFVLFRGDRTNRRSLARVRAESVGHRGIDRLLA